MYKLLLIMFLFCSSLYAQIPDGYYEDAEGLSGEDLKSALHEIIDDHVEFPYTSGGTDVWDILKETDRDPDNPDNVILFYTGWSVDAEQEYNNGNGWNREHVWAKSHGDFGTSMGPGTDVHHLRPCDISVNSARGNKDFDNGGTEYIDGDGPTGCFRDADSWEPRDDEKGDVARMIFYMAVRYEGDSGEIDLELVDYVNSSPDPVHGKFSTLMEWNFYDPVDDFEQNRNDIIFEDYQGNRNPFIDHPEYALQIWGDEVFEAVYLADFQVVYEDEHALLTWTTTMENENLLWNIYRSENSDFGQSFQINDTAIPGQGTTFESTDYEYSDPNDIISGVDYYYWLENVNYAGLSWLHGSIIFTLTGIHDFENLALIKQSLQNYPNPFNPETIISFQLSGLSEVELIIYNIKGERIRNLVNQSLSPGGHSFIWNGRNNSGKKAASGLYLYRLRTAAGNLTRKMMLLE